MPRNLPTALVNEHKRVITRPRYLVELGFNPTIYLSTRGETYWNGKKWGRDYAITIGDLEWDGSSFQQLPFVVGNTDRRFGKLAAAVGVRGRSIVVWDAAGANPYPALNDVQPYFEGVIQDSDKIDEKQVSLRAINQQLDQMYTPREFWSAAFGWSQAQPARGRSFTFGGQKFRLDAED